MHRYTLAAIYTVALTAAPAATAASITWSLGGSFVGPGGEATLLTNGSTAAALNFGDVAPRTVSGVTFLAGTFGGLSFTGGGNPGTTSNDFNAILNSFSYTAGSGQYDYMLAGLTTGQDYQVQIFVYDTRSCCSARTQTVSDGAGNTSATITHAQGQSIVGTFTAGDVTQVLRFNGDQSVIINAISLRDVTAVDPGPGPGGPSEVPEPGTLAISAMGLTGLFALRRRRR